MEYVETIQQLERSFEHLLILSASANIATLILKVGLYIHSNVKGNHNML